MSTIASHNTNGPSIGGTYHALSRVSTLVTPVSGYAYRYGPTGTRSSSAEVNGRTLNWIYDGIYRLTQETIADAPSGRVARSE